MIAVAALAVLLAMLFSGAVYAEEREAKELTQQGEADIVVMGGDIRSALAGRLCNAERTGFCMNI